MEASSLKRSSIQEQRSLEMDGMQQYESEPLPTQVVRSSQAGVGPPQSCPPRAQVGRFSAQGNFALWLLLLCSPWATLTLHT